AATGKLERHDSLDLVGCIRRNENPHLYFGGHGLWDRDFLKVFDDRVDSSKIFLDDSTTLVPVTLLDRLADTLNALLPRQHAADGEEAGLQDGVHPRPKAQALRDAARVDHEEAQTLLDDMLLYRSR